MYPRMDERWMLVGELNSDQCLRGQMLLVTVIQTPFTANTDGQSSALGRLRQVLHISCVGTCAATRPGVSQREGT